MTQCVVLKKSNNVSVVRYRDVTNNYQAVIVSAEYTNGARIGHIVDVPEHAIHDGTEYGVDWTILLDTITITPEEIQQALRKHNIWTQEDFLTNAAGRNAAILSLVNKLSSEMVSKLREI